MRIVAKSPIFRIHEQLQFWRQIDVDGKLLRDSAMKMLQITMAIIFGSVIAVGAKVEAGRYCSLDLLPPQSFLPFYVDSPFEPQSFIWGIRGGIVIFRSRPEEPTTFFITPALFRTIHIKLSDIPIRHGYTMRLIDFIVSLKPNEIQYDSYEWNCDYTFKKHKK